MGRLPRPSRRGPAALVTVGLLGLLAAGCGGGSGGSGGSSAPATPGAGSSGSSGPSGSARGVAAGCTAPPSPQASPQHYASEPPLTVARTVYTATVVTNCGTIVVRMDAAKTPHTVNSFAFLARHGYFTDTPCHRLTTSGIYVLQCGDPTGTGTGGPGYTLPDENLAGATYPAGTVAMANTGQPHTGGSQFFFVYRATALPPQYTPFGTVTSGLPVLLRIAAAGTDNSNGPGDGHPRAPVYIERFTVTKG